MTCIAYRVKYWAMTASCNVSVPQQTLSLAADLAVVPLEALELINVRNIAAIYSISLCTCS